jgi:predicted permease
MMNEWRLAVRRLVAQPATAAGIIIVLTLGIGISVGMFSILNGILFRALPYPNGEQVVLIYSENLQRGVARSGLTAAEAVEVLANVSSFEYTAYFVNAPAVTVVGGDRPHQISVLDVSPDYFSVFGLPASAGRTLVNGDFREGAAVAVLNYRAWELLGGGSDLIGSNITFDGDAYNIVGVLPPVFGQQEVAQLFRPMMPPESSGPYGARRAISAIGRLAPDASAGLISDALDRRVVAVNESQGVPDLGWRLRYVSLLDNIVGNVRNVLVALFGVSLLVLFVACSTAVTLVTIRIRRRSRELAVLQALGAGRARLAMSVVTELLLMFLVATGAGILFAYAAIEIFKPLSGGFLPRVEDIELDRSVALFSALASGFALCLSGAGPVWRAIGMRHGSVVRGGGSSEPKDTFLASLVPIVGISLSSIALVVALSLSLSISSLRDVDVGFRVDNVGAAAIVRRQLASEDDQFLSYVLQDLRATPGVRNSVAVLAGSPASANMLSTDVAAEGEEPIRANIQAVTGDYHRVFDIDMMEGRDISERDVSGVQQVAVINETLARLAFGDMDPIGRTMEMSQRMFEVVGVAADRKNAGLRAPTKPEFVISLYQWQAAAATIFVDFETTSFDWPRVLEEVIWRVDPVQAISREFLLSDELESQTNDLHFLSSAANWFAMASIILVAIGLNAIAAVLQRSRIHEIGIRLALGAKPWQAALVVVRHAVRIVGVGIVFGALLSVPTVVVLQRWFFQLDPYAFVELYGFMAFVMVGLACVASSWPAWRASCVSPREALRYE